MRRAVLIFTIFLLGVAAAAPALGQTRDPFEPQPGDSQEGTTGGSDSTGDDPFEPEVGDRSSQETPDDPTVAPTTEPVPDPDPEPQPTVDSGTLSNTGFDVSTWGGIAYLLVVLGAAALIVAWMYAPRPYRRHR